MAIPKLFVATKAIIRFKDKILLLRESDKYSVGTNNGKYDVVGGRLKPGQRYDLSLLREIKEETGLEVEIGKPFFIDEWRPIVKGEQWQIVGIFFECIAKSDKVKLSKDHDQFVWIKPEDYKKFSLLKNYDKLFEAYLKLKNLS